jgi:hypothetical protein
MGTKRCRQASPSSHRIWHGANARQDRASRGSFQARTLSLQLRGRGRRVRARRQNLKEVRTAARSKGAMRQARLGRLVRPAAAVRFLQTENKKSRGRSRRGLSSCDDGDMPVICPTGQAQFRPRAALCSFQTLDRRQPGDGRRLVAGLWLTGRRADRRRTGRRL